MKSRFLILIFLLLGSAGYGQIVTTPTGRESQQEALVKILAVLDGAKTGASPSTTSEKTVTWTQTVVTLTAATSQTLIAANTARKALRWMVTGANPMTVAPGAVTVTAGAGMNYSPGSGTGFQGGSDSFPGEVSTQAFSAISTSGTTVVIWEGI